VKTFHLSWLVIALWLIGCAGTTPRQLLDNPAGTIDFMVDRNYEDVYRDVVNHARNKYSSGSFHQVESDLFPAARKGQVAIGLRAVMPLTFLYIDITALSDTATHVTVYYARCLRPTARRAEAAAVQAWATGLKEDGPTP